MEDLHEKYFKHSLHTLINVCTGILEKNIPIPDSKKGLIYSVISLLAEEEEFAKKKRGIND